MVCCRYPCPRSIPAPPGRYGGLVWMVACQYRWEASLATLIPRYGIHAANKAKIHRKCHFWSLRIDLGAWARIEGHGYREESIPSGRGKYWASPEPSIRAQRLEFQKRLLFFQLVHEFPVSNLRSGLVVDQSISKCYLQSATVFGPLALQAAPYHPC